MSLATIALSPQRVCALYGEYVSHKLGCPSSPLYQVQLYFLAPLTDLGKMRVVHIGPSEPPPCLIRN
jgi:hypothetical protein